MKFKRKIRQPKKAKKVTLARIRDIVKEELAELHPPLMYSLTEEQKNELKKKDFNLFRRIGVPCDGGKDMQPPFMYEKPLAIRPVSPPPRVSAKKIAEYEIEEEKI